VPGTGLAPGKWTRFASIPTQGPQLVPGTATGAWDRNWCLAPGWQQFASIRPRFKGAWHRVGSSLLASGHDLKVPGTNGTPGTIGYWLPTAGHFRWEPTNAGGWPI
jgi:hypothetical protein